ncbi:hypothetical protein AVEN_205771-1 [Araneus ventricosus]|uniref:Uncharacterized protein n=1 Tax=Araneus ventricosus TaxID=182803 RepID=A0A4Y2Q1J4_ARAVE|nr:hypothetical protein AVEN_205771-1 [Araneus ventricosus]
MLWFWTFSTKFCQRTNNRTLSKFRKIQVFLHFGQILYSGVKCIQNWIFIQNCCMEESVKIQIRVEHEIHVCDIMASQIFPVSKGLLPLDEHRWDAFEEFLFAGFASVSHRKSSIFCPKIKALMFGQQHSKFLLFILSI